MSPVAIDRFTLPRDAFDAVLFDMDGVVTDTAGAHAAAWKRLFDAFLESHAARGSAEFEPFDANADYRQYVDGKPRFEGVQGFLDARGIELPRGTPEDGPELETVCGLGNRKDGYFNDWLSRNPVRVFPGTLEFIEAMRAAGVCVVIFSASRNMDSVLDSARIGDLFDARVDGRLMTRLGLPGKPDPAMLLTAASEAGVPPEKCVIVEDAIAGVQAGARGGFRCVIGIDRADYAEALRSNGADLVVHDLSELGVDAAGNFALKNVNGLAGLRDAPEARAVLRSSREFAVLLDYDGTLTPIVSDYRKAFLDDSMRATLRKLSGRHPVAVISGRDLEDVRNLVDLDTIFYSGSHGFELAGPGGYAHVHEHAASYLPDLDEAEKALREGLATIPGHAVERKRFSIAVHYRQVDDSRTACVESTVNAVLDRNTRLSKGLGKKVFELKPAVDWDKGRAVELLLQTLVINDSGALAVYVGDDVTDEAVFRVLRPPNISVVIKDSDRITAADYVLTDTGEVQRFLDWLCEPADEAWA